MVLQTLFPDAKLPTLFEAARLIRGAAADDVLDSVIAAWSARRVADGAFHVIPVAPLLDSRGLRMEMVY